MRVLFLALGANRRLAVTEESRALAEAGGSPIVLVDNASSWTGQEFAPGVEVVSLAGLAGAHWPGAVERLIGRRLHRRVFLPLYRRLWGDAGGRQLDEFRRRRGPFDAVVVTDPVSFPAAERLAADRPAQRIAFRLDQLTGPGSRGTL